MRVGMSHLFVLQTTHEAGVVALLSQAGLRASFHSCPTKARLIETSLCTRLGWGDLAWAESLLFSGGSPPLQATCRLRWQPHLQGLRHVNRIGGIWKNTAEASFKNKMALSPSFCLGETGRSAQKPRPKKSTKQGRCSGPPPHFEWLPLWIAG